MIYAKNYETVSILLKVRSMERKTVASFFRTGCSCATAAVFSELHDRLASQKTCVIDALSLCGS